jgi:hypothetical protein
VLRSLITGATALATLLTPTDANAATMYAATARVSFAGTVASSSSGALLVSVRSGRRDGSPGTVTVYAAAGASIRLNGRAAALRAIRPSARVSITGNSTASGSVQATDITATR